MGDSLNTHKANCSERSHFSVPFTITNKTINFKFIEFGNKKHYINRFNKPF